MYTLLEEDGKNYGAENETFIHKEINGQEHIALPNDFLLYDMFEKSHIEDFVNLRKEVKELKKQRLDEKKNDNDDDKIKEIDEKIEKKKQEMKEYINNFNLTKEDANIVISQLKLGRISANDLSKIFLIDKYGENEFTKTIIDEIRNNNLTIIQYKRNGKIFCVSANANDENLNLDVLKYTLEDKLNKNDKDVYIKNYTHGTWGDIKDLRKSGFYNNKQQYDEDNKTVVDNNKAWLNSKNLEIADNENVEQKADIFILNNNHPHENILDVPTIHGMVERGEQSSKVLNKVLEAINNYSKEHDFEMNKNIISTGVSNGNIHILNNIKKIDTKLLNKNDKISFNLESIPSYGIFTSDPNTETAELFMCTIFSKNGIYKNIDKIKIETNLSKKYHPNEAVYGFMEGVYEYFINNDDITEEQMKEFHDKLIIQDKLKNECEEIYKKSLALKQKLMKMPKDERDKEREKNTKLKKWRLIVYVILCFTILGAFSYYFIQKSQYEEDKKKASIIKIDKKTQKQDNNKEEEKQQNNNNEKNKNNEEKDEEDNKTIISEKGGKDEKDEDNEKHNKSVISEEDDEEEKDEDNEKHNKSVISEEDDEEEHKNDKKDNEEENKVQEQEKDEDNENNKKKINDNQVSMTNFMNMLLLNNILKQSKNKNNEQKDEEDNKKTIISGEGGEEEKDEDNEKHNKSVINEGDEEENKESKLTAGQKLQQEQLYLEQLAKMQNKKEKKHIDNENIEDEEEAQEHEEGYSGDDECEGKENNKIATQQTNHNNQNKVMQYKNEEQAKKTMNIFNTFSKKNINNSNEKIISKETENEQEQQNFKAFGGGN